MSFFLVVIVLAYACWWLGTWQFHRLADRKHDNAVIRTNESRTPAPVADVLAPGRPADLRPGVAPGDRDRHLRHR